LLPNNGTRRKFYIGQVGKAKEKALEGIDDADNRLELMFKPQPESKVTQ